MKLPVIGHVPWQVGLDDLLAGGQLAIEHRSGYINPAAADFIIAEDRLDHYAALTRQAGHMERAHHRPLPENRPR